MLAFVDADLSPEQLNRVQEHLDRCGPCARQVSALTEMIHDVAAPLPPSLDVTAHVQSIMGRLTHTPSKRAEPRRAYWMSALLAAAATVVFVALPKGELAPGVFTARGGHAQPTLARDVGVQLYLRDPSLQPLTAARRIKASSALTAGLRNLGRDPAYLLLFAVDAHNAVHWIAPEFTVTGSDPVAVSVPTSTSEQPLPYSVVFDDLAPGALRIVALLAPRPLHVSQIESLPAGDLTQSGLKKHFAEAEVRQTMVEVTRE
jgi:hypothetical protein